MSKQDKYAPKHRAPGKHKAVRAPRRALRTGVALTGLAAAVTGVSVTSGLASVDPDVLSPAAADVATTSASASASASPSTSPSASPEATADAAADERRDSRQVASRSARRTDKAKATALEMAGGSAVTRSEKLSEGDPRDIARALLPAYGFSSDQFSCLDSLYVSESDWRVDADNPTSSAYGIPQALTQLHELPADYMTSAESQIRWGLEYIQDTYGTPCSAWSFKQGNGWY
ncbi:lytic transglycosylase domain-containing protein [Nocardioides sp. zg-1230]|uniref:aggregation-promoting factor C-terminal-like domain-containing protein n=1 Tax=Nocardioides sp. zg-1230 TaxID=2736601 RepID=UPI001551BFEE|nr:lytic transglycosylase domain-containing protein [Nocardioides sp. zg-1230]NPC45174.1 lytic transglycosylase domain-containing protein [Nocardioides sp. zg-1230]